MPSGLVSHYPANDHQVGFPSVTNLNPWTFEFRQSRLHPIRQVLRDRLRYSLFHSIPAFTTGSVSPWGFPSFQVSGVTSGGLSW